MYGAPGSLRPSKSMADLTSESSTRHQGPDVRQRSGCSAGLLDASPGLSHVVGPKRFSTPSVSQLATHISQAELLKLPRIGGGRDRRDSNFSVVSGSQHSAGRDAPPYHDPLTSLPTQSYDLTSPPADYGDNEEQFFDHSDYSESHRTRKISVDSNGSGLEMRVLRKYSDSPSQDRFRASSFQGDVVSGRLSGSQQTLVDDESGIYNPGGSGIRGSENHALERPGPVHLSPSLADLQNAKLGLRSATDKRLSPSAISERSEDSAHAPRAFLTPQHDGRNGHGHSRSMVDMTDVGYTHGGPPPPPPRPSRLTSKRFSVPDLLDSGDYDAVRDHSTSNLYRRRMTAGDVLASIPTHSRSSSDDLSVDSIQDSASRQSLRSDASSRHVPPAPPPPPSSGSLSLDRSVNSKSPSLRRMVMETRSLTHSSTPNNSTRNNNRTSKTGINKNQSLPFISITDDDGPAAARIPESDYHGNNLSPTSTSPNPRGHSPHPLSRASSINGSKRNIYTAMSDATSTSCNLSHKGGVGADDTRSNASYNGGDDTRSSNADSGLGEKEVHEDTGAWRPYDAFQVSEREVEDEDRVFREILKVLRLVLYFFITVTVLVGTVASRLSLFLLTSGISQDKKSQGECVVMLLFCICCPIAISWFLAFVRILFSGKEWPSFLTFLFLLIVELLQTFGVCLLLFRVLPVTDFFRGITITMAAFQFPALLKLILAERKLNLGLWPCMKMFAAILAFAAQVGAIVFFLITQFSGNGVNETIPEGKVPQNVPQLSSLMWELPLALALMSLGWWENYVSGEWSMCGKVTLSFKRARKVVQDARDTSTFLVAPFKVGLAVLLAKYLTGATFRLPEQLETDKSDSAEFHMEHYSLLYLQMFASMLVTYLASLACKLRMQKAAFALPLLLSPPASLAVVYVQCRYEFLPGEWHMGLWLCPSLALEDLVLPLSCAAALWVSYCLVVSHVWFPSSERMAKVQKLFITPHFDAIFPDFHLTLRRRRNDHELRATRLEQFTYVGEDNPYYGEEEEEKDSSDVTTPMVYVCATMWHETTREMTQLLKSLFRLDYAHCASKLAQEQFQIKDPDYYDLEIHVMFDDSFELDDEADKFVPNIFVRQMIECMEEAAGSVVKGPIDIPPPVKIPTPYGGMLVWTMPGLTKMHVHLKNKNLIRHRKRWSQCMYLYYLLGYRLLGGKDDKPTDTASESEPEDPKYANVRQRGDKQKVKGKGKGKAKRRKAAAMPLRSLLGHMQPDKYEKTVQRSENTFILTLDGDVDFKPDSVRLLLDRMKKNKKVGAVCGRIHPIGAGPMVWYQQFEYAVGHWLQKASEHVFGCVLCCPGCFSLFRGSALMDDNVMKKYTTKPTEAAHYIQFEQGEDRWLCTLLLQQGHRIDYSAGADALTYAPETFNEFFNQRRRWSPSTLANMMDLLSTWRETVRINDNVSRLYILYQFLLMASSILAPSTVILMITGSYHSVLGLSILWAFLLSLAPVVFYLLICLTQKNDVQIKVGAVLSALYTVVMMIATVGTMVSIATESFNSPNVVFLTGLFVIFFVAALLHPQEFFCLVYGALYFLVVPSTFILLTVFYLCNLNNVSWGTREMPKKMNPEEEEAQKKAEEEKAKKKKKNIFSLYGMVNLVHELRDAIRGLWGLRNELHQQSNVLNQQQGKQGVDDVESGVTQPLHQPAPPPPPPPPPSDRINHPTGHEPNPESPYWLNLDYLGYGVTQRLGEEEKEFWKFLIHKYLHPIDEDKSQKIKIAEDLAIIRNNVVFIYVMMNFLWCVIALQLQAMEDTLKSFYIVEKYEPLSLVFLSIFALVLLLQFLSMLVHRWGTFLHLMSSTRVDWFKKNHSEEEFARFVVNQTKRLQNLEPLPDYDDEQDAGFNSDEDGMSMSDFDPSLRQPQNPSAGTIGEQDGGGIYETLGHHSYLPYNPPRPTNLNRSTSTRGQFPMLKTIFDQKMNNLQQRYQHRGTMARTAVRSPGLWGGTQRRYWGDRDLDMRQRFFHQNFQMPPQSRGGRVYRHDPGMIV